ncbi:glutathione S-transferase family protein [Celeribacter sp. ULVN23_4]
MSEIILHHGATSVCSQKVRLALAEIGLRYESQLVDLAKGEQFAPAYLALNPEAVVPTLLDGDLVLRESSLIIYYLDRQHNAGQFMPQDLRAAEATRLWLLRCLDIHAAVNTLSFATVMRHRALANKTTQEIVDDIARMPDPLARLKRMDLMEQGCSSPHVDKGLRVLAGAFRDMSQALSGHQWLSGPAFGLTDIALLAYLDRLDRLGFAGFWGEQPEISDWLSRMVQRDSYAIAVTGFISESAARGMRAEGERHWPDLKARWEARPVED